MKIVYKSNPNYWHIMQEANAYTFSVKDYTYFYSREEWEAIPTINQQPVFNPETEYLLLQEIEQNGQVVRQWVKDIIPPEEQLQP